MTYYPESLEKDDLVVVNIHLVRSVRLRKDDVLRKQLVWLE